MKRIGLFLLTNLAIMLVLSLVVSLLGGDRFLTRQGLDLGSLLIFSAVFGMGGSFISLAMSKWMAKRSTGAVVIEQPQSAAEAWLLATVERQARAAGIGMPEVAVYDAPEINAFATGMSRNSALVAVSTGLLRSMSQDETEAVLGHEIAHVANGDMVTLTLIQGVLNTFVIFLSKIIGYAVDSALKRNDSESSGPGMGYYITSMVMQLVLGFAASIVVAWFSRRREFAADAGGAHYAGKRKMIAALQKLKAVHEPSSLPQGMQAMGIAGGVKSLFMTHPPLEDRIARLQASA